MTKILSGFVLGLIMIFILSDCGRKKTDKSGTKAAMQTESNSDQNAVADESAAKYKVTFIELGSVRCIPCQQMQPIMDTIRVRYGKQVNVVFHDVWTEQGTPFADKYGVNIIPTQVFLDEDGTEYFRHVGFFPLDELVNVLNQKGVK